MRFQELLNENAMQMKMRAADKEDVLRQLCALLYADGCIASASLFYEAIRNREACGMTAIGGMIAIPHGCSDTVLRSCVAVARLEKSVMWDAAAQQSVRAVLLFAIQADQSGLQLRAMAATARFLGQDEYQKRLLRCRTKRQLCRLMEEMPLGELDARLRLVAVTACPAGVAHTYISKECLVQAALARRHSIKVETQGAIGTENRLTEGEIRAADVVILAADTEVEDMERFEGKRIVRVPTAVVVRSADLLIEKIEARMGKCRGMSCE